MSNDLFSFFAEYVLDFIMDLFYIYTEEFHEDTEEIDIFVFVSDLDREEIEIFFRESCLDLRGKFFL